MIDTLIQERVRQTEVSILAGCSHCGRRLVAFGPPRIINGGVLILRPDSDEEVPYCGECVNALFPEAI